MALDKGFALVELLIVSFIILVLGGAMYVFLFADQCCVEQEESTDTPTPTRKSVVVSTPIPTVDDSNLTPVPIEFQSYPIVDTGQTKCYNAYTLYQCPNEGERWHGQDAQYTSALSYKDNGDGTITDIITGLMWQKEFKQIAWNDVAFDAANTKTGGYTDWRVPTIKELYSLIDFGGNTGSVNPDPRSTPEDAIPYINTNYFAFEYGQGDRYIDAQYLSSTEYVSTTMMGNDTVFGVNFADGRIKGYPKTGTGGTGMFYVRYVRGNPDYGKNKYMDNGNGTIRDTASWMTWQKGDSGSAMSWEDALAYCEELTLAGSSDWRLPNAKELQSIVDYTRSPDTTDSAAIDPIFEVTPITNEGGDIDYPFYWTSTTHVEGNGNKAVYVAFGRALGYMEGPQGLGLMDVHGAGAQLSDFKTGDPDDYPQGHGPQGDVVRIENFARCVR